MRPEIALLLYCASSFFKPEAEKDLASILARGVDWGYFLYLTVYHRAIFPVFRCLSRSAAGEVPSPILDELREIHMRTLAFNLQASRDLVEIVGALDKAGRPAIVYKGPLLAVSAYGDLGARQFTDLDILVRPGDFPSVCDDLDRLGYQPSDGLAHRPSGLTLRLLRDMIFWNRVGRVPLEVQWRLAQLYHPVFPRPEELWLRCRRAAFEGAELLTFSPEDTLLVLCLHGLYHAWGQLQMVTDVAAVIRSLRPDWERTLDLARRNRAERILFLGLLLAHRMLSIGLPEGVLARASTDRVAAPAAEDSLRRFFHPEDWTNKARRYFFREAGMFPGLGNQARYFIGRLTTPNEEDLAGRPLSWTRLMIMPFLRLIRLFRKYSHRLR
ncbi:MAG TPA: nucleotidyltransferase family protein [Acidobacteriota bacterium]